MKREYQTLFDQVHAPQRLREEVLQMTKQERRKSHRISKGILAAAILLVILAGSAIASVGMPGTLRDWFSRVGVGMKFFQHLYDRGAAGLCGRADAAGRKQ